MDDIKSISKKGKESSYVSELEQENAQLKKRIEQMEAFIKGQSNSVSAEELICVEQISIIKQKSQNRELSLDEVKRLDLLIKNLRLIKDQSTQVVDHKDYRNVKEIDLVAIARSPEPEEDN